MVVVLLLLPLHAVVAAVGVVDSAVANDTSSCCSCNDAVKVNSLAAIADSRNCKNYILDKLRLVLATVIFYYRWIFAGLAAAAAARVGSCCCLAVAVYISSCCHCCLLVLLMLMLSLLLSLLLLLLFFVLFLFLFGCNCCYFAASRQRHL